jgi:hypothetical protein
VAIFFRRGDTTDSTDMAADEVDQVVLGQRFEFVDVGEQLAHGNRGRTLRFTPNAVSDQTVQELFADIYSEGLAALRESFPT